MESASAAGKTAYSERLTAPAAYWAVTFGAAGSWSDCVLPPGEPVHRGQRLGSADASRADPAPHPPELLRAYPGSVSGWRSGSRSTSYGSDDSEAFGLADAIREVKEKVGLCEVCFNLAEGPRCRICEDERREGVADLVVEEPADVIPIERTGECGALPRARRGALADRWVDPRT